MMKFVKGRFTIPEWLLIFIFSSAITILSYYKIIGYGFDYDDYHFVRQYDFNEVISTFKGDWDSSNIERTFYRPLTISFFAARFLVFKFNPALYHVLSIVMFSVASVLFFFILKILTRNLTGSYIGVIIFILYPYMVHSAVAWATNQMHLLQILIFFAAWLYFLHFKNSKYKIFGLLLFQIVTFLIKEDGILLLPTIFILDIIYNVLFKTKTPHKKTSAVFWGGSSLVILCLFLLRKWSLKVLGGYNEISFYNYFQTLKKIILLEGIVRWDSTFSMVMGQSARLITILILLLGFIGFNYLSKKELLDLKIVYLLLSGISILLLYNILTIFSTKIYQWHFQSVGHIIIITSAILALWGIPLKFLYRIPVVIIVFVLFLTYYFSTRYLVKTFDPYSYQTIEHDKKVLGWGIELPQQHREILKQKMQNPLFHKFDE